VRARADFLRAELLDEAVDLRLLREDEGREGGQRAAEDDPAGARQPAGAEHGQRGDLRRGVEVAGEGVDRERGDDEERDRAEEEKACLGRARAGDGGRGPGDEADEEERPDAGEAADAAGGAGRPFALDADGEAAESGHEKAGERFVREVGVHAGPSWEERRVYDLRRRRGAVSEEAAANIPSRAR